MPRRLGSRLEGLRFRGREQGRCSPACGCNGGAEVGAGEAEVPKGVLVGETWAVMAKGGDQSIKGSLNNAANGSVVDDVDVDPVAGAEGKRSGVPDGVEEDVVDGVERAVAVAGDEEAAR
jgi:hypothetical protein